MVAGEHLCAEFDCCECGRHILVITASVVPDPPLCAACLMAPGWFRHPGIRACIDPKHDGRDLAEVVDA